VANAGRGNLAPDEAVGESVPMLIDLPMSGNAGADAFGVTLAVGSGGRFKPTIVVIEANGQPLASVRADRASLTGVATSVLVVGSATLIDRLNSVTVALSNPAGLLYHADQDALAMGSNAMLIGAELIQFGRAEALGGGAYRLSELLRGRRGTEFAIATHWSGEPIVLLDPASLVHVAIDSAIIGATVVARAYGVADDETAPPGATIVAGGESLRPLSPCHVSVEVDGAGTTLRWVARRASAFGWAAGGGDEVGAASFQVTVRRGGGVLSRVTANSFLTIAAAEIAALGSGAIEFDVIEQGMVPSRSALRTINA
jgi:hypothetical protein